MKPDNYKIEQQLQFPFLFENLNSYRQLILDKTKASIWLLFVQFCGPYTSEALNTDFM